MFLAVLLVLVPLVPLGVMVKGLVDVARGRGRAAWKMAAWGLGLFCVTALLVWTQAWASYQSARHKTNWASCISNMKNLTLTLKMYQEDNDGFFPPAETWCEAVRPYVKNADVFKCPAGPDSDCGHAMNSALGGVRLDEDARTTSIVAIFESDAGWNAHGGPSLLPDEPRRDSRGEILGDYYGFADGHVQWIKRKKLPDGTWAKEPEADVIWEAVVAAEVEERTSSLSP